MKNEMNKMMKINEWINKNNPWLYLKNLKSNLVSKGPIDNKWAFVQVKAEVKRMCGCPEEWVAELVWLNFMSVPIIKK